MITKINKNLTIDLKKIIAQDYIDSRKSNFTRIKEKTLKYISIAWIVWFIIVFSVGWGIVTPPEANGYNTGENMSIRDKIRLERLEVCQKAYKMTHINEQFIYKQIPAVRCATYMSLIYAYESNFWKSERCVRDKNCFGIKWNWIDTPRWFLKFETETQGREYFAKKYFKFHYKKKVSEFVKSWSMTDQDTYINFVSSKYWNMYKELEYLYITWEAI